MRMFSSTIAVRRLDEEFRRNRGTSEDVTSQSLGNLAKVFMK